MIKELNSLHHKILHNTSFASEVTESEIQALVMAKELLEHQKQIGFRVKRGCRVKVERI